MDPLSILYYMFMKNSLALATWATGSVRQYWIIERNGSLLRPIGGQATQDHLQSVQERERNRGHNRGPGYPAAAQEAAKSSHLTFDEERLWLGRTGWPETYKGRGRDLLSALAGMPSHLSPNNDIISPESDETRITALLKLVDEMMDRRPLSSNPKPFSLVRQPSSTKKYRLPFKKALVFVFRAYRLNPSIREKLAGIQPRKKLGEAEERNDNSGDNNDETYAENRSNENWKAITSENNELQELLFGLSLALCAERSIDSQPSSILLASLPARSYTSYLSGLIYIQRLLFLEQALPLRPYGALGINRRPRARQLERLQAIRKKWMILGSQSAFDESFAFAATGAGPISTFSRLFHQGSHSPL
ncbi:hypothetical protein V8C42DRAFT_356200 [Trichoderma barbatum]